LPITIKANNFDLIINNNLGGAISASPLPSDKELEKYYESKYWQTPDRPYNETYSEDELNHLSLKQDLILSLIPTSHYTALDIGCGEGFFLKKLLDRGVNVIGLDFNDYAVSKFNPSTTPYLMKGNIFTSIQKIIDSKVKYNVIFLNHIFEHITHPEYLLAKLKEILSNPGYLVISVPNDFSELQKEMKVKNYYIDEYFVKFPDHLHYFTASSLKLLLKQSGFRFLDGIADFPIEWFIANKHSNYASNQTLGKDAHRARIFIETLINKRNSQLALALWRSLFELGEGRSITALFEFSTKTKC
jgi:2-polyprenyl-3-methyl-5-hydroxy-6-metoxy-1,4-benzoquinol methylase